MSAKLIKTKVQYETALTHVDKLMSAKPGTPQFDELELWVLIIEAYEQKHYPISLPTPVAAIEFEMDQQQLTRADLIPYIGGKSKVSEVLSGKRSLSLAMIRKLHAGLDISLDVLIQNTSHSIARTKKSKTKNARGTLRPRATAK